MKSIKSFFEGISLRKLLIVFLTGVLVLFTTACGATRAMSPPSANPSESGQNMYPHKDTERDTSAADAKAERLIRESRRNTREFQSPKDFVERVTPDRSLQEQAEDVGESAKRAAQRAGESAKQTAEETAEGTRRGFRNLKENTQEALDRASSARSPQEAVERAADALD